MNAVPCDTCGGNCGQCALSHEGGPPNMQMMVNRLHGTVRPKPRTSSFQCGWLFRWGSLWIGAHWSPYNRRWCINPLPCCTFWIALPGGKTPQK